MTIDAESAIHPLAATIGNQAAVEHERIPHNEEHPRDHAERLGQFRTNTFVRGVQTLHILEQYGIESPAEHDLRDRYAQSEQDLKQDPLLRMHIRDKMSLQAGQIPGTLDDVYNEFRLVASGLKHPDRALEQARIMQLASWLTLERIIASPTENEQNQAA